MEPHGVLCRDEIQARLKHRSLIIVISDLHDERAVPTIRKLAQRHDCAVLQLQDPAERGRLRAGLVRGVEAETGKKFVARSRSREIRGDPVDETSLVWRETAYESSVGEEVFLEVATRNDRLVAFARLTLPRATVAIPEIAASALLREVRARSLTQSLSVLGPSVDRTRRYSQRVSTTTAPMGIHLSRRPFPIT